MDPGAALAGLTHRGDRRSVLVGLVTALLVAALALTLMLLPSRPWTASASLVVLPDPRLTPTDAASYYDKLGSDLVATFAQVVADAAGGAAPGRTAIAVAVVPNSTIIAVTGTSSDPVAAVTIADSAAARGVGALDRLGTPYLTRVLSPAVVSLQRAPRTGVPLIVLVAGATGLLAGLAAQQASWMLGRRRVRPAADREREDGDRERHEEWGAAPGEWGVEPDVVPPSPRARPSPEPRTAPSPSPDSTSRRLVAATVRPATPANGIPAPTRDQPGGEAETASEPSGANGGHVTNEHRADRPDPP